VLALGVTLTGFVYFDAGLGLVTIAVCWVGFDFWRKFHDRKRRRIPAILALAFLYALFLWRVLVPAPLTFETNIPAGDYPAGTNILGITWKKEYYPVEVIIGNDTDHEYSNFDSYIRTNNTYMDHPGMKVGINQCTATPENPHVGFFGLTFSYKDSKGATISIPLSENDDHKLSSFYRVRCDKIAAHSTIEVLLPVIGPEQPSWVAISAKYDAANISRAPFIPKCILSDCRRVSLPNSF
jgi:hypothetical protein